MGRRGDVWEAESPFLAEALETQEQETPAHLIPQLAALARQLAPSARRHLERALVRQLLDSGVRERAALASAVATLRREAGFARETEAEAEDHYESSEDEGPTAAGEEHCCGEGETLEEVNESPFLAGESEGESPFLAAESEDESPFLAAEAEAENEAENEDEAEAEDEGESPFLAAEAEDESPFLASEDEEPGLREETAYEEEAEAHEGEWTEAEGEGEALNEAEGESESEEEGEAEAEAEAEEENYELSGESEPIHETETEFASLSPSELKAVRITSTFETGRAGGFGGLTANVDGQGLSFGLMNWTIKAGSLIPLLKEFIEKHHDRYARIFGRDAERFRDMVFATRPSADGRHKVRDVEAQMDFVRGQMNDAAQRTIVEPWKAYFGGLENDPEFRKIEVAAARKGLAHARRWFDRLGFKTERGFVFLFDLVSSHGAWWLDAKKFHGRREKLLAERLAGKKAELGRALSERETMAVIANMIADVGLERWRKQARARKLWFVRGTGKVHGTHYDLARDFGVTDAAPDFGNGSSLPSVGGPLGASSDRFRQLVQSGQDATAVKEAVQEGEGDPAELADRVFHARHPELGGRQIRRDEGALQREWLEVRDTLVQPTLEGASSAVASSRPAPAPPGGPAHVPVFLGLDTASVGGNKNPDWVQARDQGTMRYAIIRSNFGVWPDPVFRRDWPKIKDAGLVRGAYLFLRFPHPKYRHRPPDPVAQAEAFIKTVGTLEHSDFPPSLDVEFPGGRAATGMTAAQLMKGVRAAWKALKDHYGVAPIIYTSARVWREDLGNAAAPDLVESPLWLTPYPFKPGPAVIDLDRIAKRRRDPKIPTPWGDPTNWWIHQYQGDAVRLPGFRTGNIDMNFFNTMLPGAAGDRVKWVQRRLGIPETGTFDAAMETALGAFQSKSGLPPAPLVDPQTFAFLCWSNP
jgi:GH25 family lysozyme M1 (1,4-beta-N-acetylmuramidase)